MSKSKQRVPRGPIVDVQITPEIIDAARPRDSGYCMIAEAVRLAFPPAADRRTRVSVDLQTIRFGDADRGLKFIYLTPRSAQTALVDFDQGIEVKPFSFRLRGAHVMKTLSAKAREAKRATQALYDKSRGRRDHHGRRVVVTPDGPVEVSATRQAQSKSIERVGGREPPLQKTPQGVAFSRRREFGLRALSR